MKKHSRSLSLHWRDPSRLCLPPSLPSLPPAHTGHWLLYLLRWHVCGHQDIPTVHHVSKGTGRVPRDGERHTVLAPGWHGQAVLSLPLVAGGVAQRFQTLGTSELKKIGDETLRVVWRTETPCQKCGDSPKCVNTFYSCSIAEVDFIFIQQFLSSFIH